MSGISFYGIILSMKKILIIVVGIVGLAVILFISMPYIYRNYEILGLPNNYYKDLANKCDSGCCVQSVKSMARMGYKIEPATGCPEGQSSNMIQCGPDSYKWCEPIKSWSPKE